MKLPTGQLSNHFIGGLTMNCKQNQKINQVQENTIVVGIDIGSELHYARAFDWRGVELSKVFKFHNTLDGLNRFYQWTNELKLKTSKTSIIVGAEPTGHYWFNLAESLKNQSIRLVLVNPLHVKRSKELDDNHPSKTDTKDPKTIAKLVIEGRYSEPYIPVGAYAELRTAMMNRGRIIKELNTIKNRLERWFKIYFPEYNQVFGDYEGIASMMVLEKAPLPEDILSLGIEGINQIWRQQKVRAVGIKRATSLYNAAQTSIGVTTGLEMARFEIEILLEDYRRKKEQYDRIMMRIESLCIQIPGATKILDIKGIGLVTVAGFIAEVGDVGRFDSAKQIQKLAGLALKENSSGKHKGQTSISKRGRKRLRAILFQGVMPLVGQNEAFKSIHQYYITRPNNPLKKKQSLIAICCKIIRVFYALLTRDEVYDGEKLLRDIKRKDGAVAA